MALAAFCVWKASQLHGKKLTLARVVQGVGQMDMVVGVAAAVLFSGFIEWLSTGRLAMLLRMPWGQGGDSSKDPAGA